jgi:hypothetical protein
VTGTDRAAEGVEVGQPVGVAAQVGAAAAGCVPVATLIDVADEADVRHDVMLEPASPVAESGLASEPMPPRLHEAPAECSEAVR